MRARAVVVNAVLAATLAVASSAAAQSPEARFGRWKLKSEAPPPALNIMTYQPWGDGGMQITVESTNARGETSTWGYATLFDGEFRPVQGRDGTETSVVFLTDRVTQIVTRREGRVTQMIINKLSEDGNTILNDYHNWDGEGNYRLTQATYERIH
ncbi:MAG: hypothetical protein R3E10_11945 [Gemmatimonadota bacterium]